MASVKRVEYKSGRVVYRIVICQGYDKKGNKLVKNLTYSVNQSATPKQQEREAKKYAMDMEDKLKYGYDYNAEKILHTNGLRVLKITLLMAPMQDINRFWKAESFPTLRETRLLISKHHTLKPFIELWLTIIPQVQ